jgi:hypothetical protein
MRQTDFSSENLKSFGRDTSRIEEASRGADSAGISLDVWESCSVSLSKFFTSGKLAAS